MREKTAVITAVGLIAYISHYRAKEQRSKHKRYDESLNPFDKELPVSALLQCIPGAYACQKEHYRHIKRTAENDETAYGLIGMEKEIIQFSPRVKRLCSMIRDQQKYYQASDVIDIVFAHVLQFQSVI